MREAQAMKIVSGALVLMALIAGPSDLRAQEAGAMSWLAWSGCWVEVGAPADAPMTCVVPEDGGATLLTVTDAGDIERQYLAGDGVERPVDAGGCVGAEAAEFSDDGARIFTRSTLSCDGGTERSTRGMIAMVSQDEWIQVRALTVGQGSASWVKRYRLAPASRVDDGLLNEVDEVVRDRSTAIETARMVAAETPSVDDIIEAYGRTDGEAVRAWIVEHNSPLELDAEALIKLADAGVSEEVIDVAIAVTYPERFEVARAVDRRYDARDDRYGYWRGSGFGLYSRFDPFYYGFDRFDRFNRFHRFGYGYGFGHRGGPTVIVVRPAGEARGSGRVVKGQGYTPSGAAATGRRARPADRSGSVRAGSGYSGSKAVGSSSRGSSSGSKGKAKKKGGGGG